MNFSLEALLEVPLTPFPPGMRWRTRCEMLHEVMIDFHRGWVQDYLFRHDASVDARLLSSPVQLSKSRSLTLFDCLDMCNDQNQASTDFLGTCLLIPSFKKDDISAGVCVDHYFGHSIPPEIISRSNRFWRFVRNDRTGVICQISFDDEMGVTELFFGSMASRSYSWRLISQFKAASFEKAFHHGTVNFDIVEQSMMNMTVSYSTLGPTICGCQQSGCAECFGKLASPTPASEPFCVLDFIQMGHFYLKGVLSSYCNGVLMNALPITGSSSRNVGTPVSCINKLIRWGVFDQLRRLKPVVPVVIPFNFETCDESTSGHCVCHQYTATDNIDRIPENSENISIDASLSSPVKSLRSPSIGKDVNKGAVRIAPAAASTSSSDYNVSTALVKEMERQRLFKLERRKIRKREAAFRSNAKRRERMRIARLARQQEATTLRSEN